MDPRDPICNHACVHLLLVICQVHCAGSDLPLNVPPPDPNRLPIVEAASFQTYLQAHSSRLSKFEAALSAKQANAARELDRDFTPGDGLVEAMRIVPSMFFKDDFSLARWAPL